MSSVEHRNGQKVENSQHDRQGDDKIEDTPPTSMRRLAGCLGNANRSAEFIHRSCRRQDLTHRCVEHRGHAPDRIHPGAHGADFSVLKTAATAALLIVLLLSGLHWRRPLLPLLPPTYLFTTLLLVMTALIPEHRFYQLGHKPAVVVHISLSLAAYALFMVCALLALLVASIQQRLKQRRLAMAPGYPSLVGVEQLLQQLLALGVVILTAAVATGFLFLDGFWGQGQAHKAILTCAALLFYVALWWRQQHSGVRGRHLVFAHLLGAALLNIAYFGSRLIRELLLARA